jgi:hypothetical protein
MAYNLEMRIGSLTLTDGRALTWPRLAAAAALAAICAALPYSLFYAVMGSFTSGSLHEFEGTLQFSGMVFVIALAVTFAHTVVLGLPCVVALARLKALRLRNLLLTSVLIGVIPVSLTGGYRAAPWTALFGLIGGTAFWFGLTFGRGDAGA